MRSSMHSVIWGLGLLPGLLSLLACISTSLARMRESFPSLRELGGSVSSSRLVLILLLTPFSWTTRILLFCNFLWIRFQLRLAPSCLVLGSLPESARKRQNLFKNLFLEAAMFPNHQRQVERMLSHRIQTLASFVFLPSHGWDLCSKWELGIDWRLMMSPSLPQPTVSPVSHMSSIQVLRIKWEGEGMIVLKHLQQWERKWDHRY